MRAKLLQTIWQALKFGATGLINTAVGLSIIFAAMALGVHYALANALGFGVGMIVSYRLNKTWVFADDPARNRALIFGLCLGIAYLCNLVVLLISVERFNVPEGWAQLFGNIVYSIISFIGMKTVVFKPQA